jgi:membrane protein
MSEIIPQIQKFIVKDIWEEDMESLSGAKLYLIKTLRFLYVIGEEVMKEQLMLRATSLVFTTLVSLVPLLAVALSLLKAFGIQEDLADNLLKFLLEPLGPKAYEVTERIVDFVNNMKVGVLGSLGLAMLIYTVISVLQKIENAFNYIWKAESSRTLIQKFRDYLSILLVGPLLLFSAITLTASMASNTVVHWMLSLLPEKLGEIGKAAMLFFTGTLMPYIFVFIVLTFIYVFLPNRHVNFRSALVGGTVAGILWQTAGWGFAAFVASSSQYNAIYSGFAILIIFMLWIYVSWIILLIGSMIAYYYQYPQFLSIKKEVLQLSTRFKEKIIFIIMYLIGSHFFYNKQFWTLDALVKHLDIPIENVQEVIKLLQKKGLLIETGTEPSVYIPAKDIDTITLHELLKSVRATEKETSLIDRSLPLVPQVNMIMDKLDNALEETLKNQTLKNLILNSQQKSDHSDL